MKLDYKREKDGKKKTEGGQGRQPMQVRNIVDGKKYENLIRI